MNYQKLLRSAKVHIAEPGKRTGCGKPQTGRKVVTPAQAELLRDGARSRLCWVCDRADTRNKGD